MDKEKIDKMICSGLVHRYASKICNNQQIAEDVAQDSIVKIITKASGIKDTAALESWAYRVVLNTFLDNRNAAARKMCVSIDDPGNDIEYSTAFADESLNPEQILNDKSDYDYIKSKIDRLDKMHQETIKLFYIDGYNTKEISTILLIPEGTVRTRLFRARLQLKRLCYVS